MTTPSWQTVGRGLWLVQLGVKVIAWAIGVTVVTSCCGLGLLTATNSHADVSRVALCFCLAALAAVVVGRLLCIVGRWKCLAIPPDATTARTRIRFAVLFETCSLLTGLTTAGFSAFDLPAREVLALVGTGISLLAAVAGRLWFLSYLVAAAESARVRSAFADAKQLFRLTFANVVAVTLGIVLVWFSYASRGNNSAVEGVFILTLLVGLTVGALAAAFSVYLLASYINLISLLEVLLSSHTPIPSDSADPDTEYRDRYIAGGGTADDT